MAEQAISGPWQAPPAFLAARVVAEMLSTELRWGPHFAQLRLVSRGWREAADDALPALTPPPYLDVPRRGGAAGPPLPRPQAAAPPGAL